MTVGEVCSREVYAVKSEQPLADAAREMRRRHVGAMVVVEPRSGSSHPIGMVTDRDIVCGQVARAADLFCLVVADVMTANPLVVAETSGVAEAIGSLSERGVRRAPVVNTAGELVGLISIDDLLPIVAEELGSLARLIGSQARRERAASGR